MSLRGMGLGKKSREKGKETKCYINRALWDRLQAHFLTAFNQDMPYGYMSDLINDALLARVTEWDLGASKPEQLDLIEAHKAGATETPTAQLLRLVKDELNPYLGKLASMADSPFAFLSQLRSSDAVEIRRLQERMVELARLALNETDLMPARPVDDEPEDKTPKFTDEERARLIDSALARTRL